MKTERLVVEDERSPLECCCKVEDFDKELRGIISRAQLLVWNMMSVVPT